MFRENLAVSHDGALGLIAGAVARAREIGVPQCIVVVDASGETIASLRMDGAKFLSLRTARAKARTAASTDAATGTMPLDIGTAAGVASHGDVTPLKGGLPIRFGGRLAGAVGVGSGTGDQDVDVARAGLAAIGADPA
ncbi:MAG TPA: heme-binding protein [Devosiaceae bacterium]